MANEYEINSVWSNVLAYKPKLNLSLRERKNNYLEYSKKKNIFSKCLNGYIEYNPCVIIDKLTNANVTNEYLLNMLEEDISKENQEFVLKYKEKDTLYVNEIIQKNRNINGNSIYEIYDVIYKDQQLIETFINQYSELYYGKLDTKEINKLNNQVLEKLKTLEEESDISKINYSALSIDLYVNTMIAAYADTVHSKNNTLYSTLLQQENLYFESNKNINSVMKNKYKEEEEKSIIAYDNYCNTASNNDLTLLFNKVCNSRNQMISSIKAANSSVNDTDRYAELITDIKDKSITKCFDDAESLMKYFIKLSIQKNEYTESLSNKEYIKNIFTATV